MARSFFYIGLVSIVLFQTSRVFAQSCDATCVNAIECRDKIAKCQEAWSQMEAAKKPHIDALRKMEADIKFFQSRLLVIEADVKKKTSAISQNEKELGGFIDTALKRIRQFYIRNKSMNMFSTLLGASDISVSLREAGYQQAVTNEDKKSIAHTALRIQEITEKKATLENEKGALATIKTITDAKASEVRKLVSEAEQYQGKLTGIIASLSLQQQAILNSRSGSFTTSVGDVPLADDPNAAPTYNPGFSPAFAAFSFGAYTHKKGMSQYGAKGRAESGQNFRDILQAYYGKSPVSKDTGGSISVSGVGSLDFEGKYLMGIAEMPSNFPKEALKAQAIAARSYAWRFKTSGQSICTTQSCQVYSSSKASNPPSEWRQAVEETKGQVLEDIVAYYSSTTGGWSITGGWDTKCGNQGCWTGDAYEKIAGSPWFYKGWYTEGYLNSSAKCGRSHPWLTSEEFSDIINAWIVRKNGSSDDAKRILPVTIKSCSFDGQSGDPYSMGELRDRAGGFGGAVSSVSNVSVSYNSGGYTDTVVVSTNRGELRIAASEFREAYNLRAPGYIAIKNTLFNIEKK